MSSMHVVLIAVVSLDGRITRPGASGADFASPEDQAWFHQTLQEFDCSILGRVSFDTIPASQLIEGQRLRVVMSRTPVEHAACVRERGLDLPAIEFTSASPVEIVANLRARGFQRCALLGGGQIYARFLDAGLVDALWLTLEPLILGSEGTPLATGRINPAHGAFKLFETRALNRSTLLLNYTIPGRPPVPLPSFQSSHP